MVTMITVQTKAMAGADPLSMIEVGVAPTVVMGVEATILTQYRMQVGITDHA